MKRISLVSIALLVFVLGGLAASCKSSTTTSTTTAAASTSTTTSKPATTTTAATTSAAPTTTSAPAKPAGTITVGLVNDLTTADPLGSDVTNDYPYRLAVFEGLTTLGPSGEQKPLLATGWKFSADGLTLDVTLRQGVKFHNGDAFTSKDVIYTINRAMDPNRSKSYSLKNNLQNMSKVEAIDDFHVRFTLSKPDPFIVANAFGRMNIQPADYTDKVGDAGFAKAPVGTGAFMWTGEWVKADHYTLQAFEGYWGTVPQMKTLVMRTITDDATRAAALQAGEIDIAEALPEPLAAKMATTPGVKVLTEPTTVMREIYINTVSKTDASGAANPFLDKRVRQALNYAVDKQAIISKLLNGYASMPAGVVGSSTPGADPSLVYAYDPVKAKALLDAAGWNPNYKFEVHVYKAGGLLVESVQAAAADWAKVGVQATVIPMESTPGLAEQVGPGPKPPKYFPMSGFRPTVWPLPYLLQSYELPTAPRYHTDDPDLVAMYDKLATLTDQAQINAQLKAINAHMFDVAGNVYLPMVHAVYGIGSRVISYQPLAGQTFVGQLNTVRFK